MLKHKGTQTIETQRLFLRRFTMGDAQAMFDNWASDPEVTKYLTWPVHSDISVTRTVLENWVAEYKNEAFYQWCIALKEDADDPIGSISVVACNDHLEKAALGYCAGKKWWNRGIMTEALGAVITYLFDEVGMKRIEAHHDPRNIYSGAVMRNCGMQYEGTLRQYSQNNLGICDISCYAIVKKDGL